MSDMRWPANSYDEARDTTFEMLRSYRIERRNLEQERRLLQEAIASLVAPRTSSLDTTRIQMTHGDDGMAQRLERIAVERRGLEAEQDRIAKREQRLNALLRVLGELNAFERHVVVAMYFDGTGMTELGTRLRKSEDTIARYRKSALRKLTRALFRVVDNSIRA